MGMNLCAWCDDETINGDKLCPACRAMEDGPRFTCSKPFHHTTMGTVCSLCEVEKARLERLRIERKEQLDSLLASRRNVIRDIKRPSSRKANRFMDGFVGQMIDGAIDDLIPIYGKEEVDRLKREAYDAAMKE